MATIIIEKYSLDGSLKKQRFTYETDDPYRFINRCIARDADYYTWYDEDWQRHKHISPKLAKVCMEKGHLEVRRYNPIAHWKRYIFVNERQNKKIDDMIKSAFSKKKDVHWRINSVNTKNGNIKSDIPF